MAILRPNLKNDVPRSQEGPGWTSLAVIAPMDNGDAHFGPKNDFMGCWRPVKRHRPPPPKKMMILTPKMRQTFTILLVLPGWFQFGLPSSLSSQGQW